MRNTEKLEIFLKNKGLTNISKEFLTFISGSSLLDKS